MNTSSFAEEARGNDSGVIKDQKVVGTEKIRKLRELRVGNSAGGAVEQQESGGIAVFERALGNLSRRELIIEVFRSHDTASVA